MLHLVSAAYNADGPTPYEGINERFSSAYLQIYLHRLQLRLSGLFMVR